MFSCEAQEIFQNSYFTKQLREADQNQPSRLIFAATTFCQEQKHCALYKNVYILKLLYFLRKSELFPLFQFKTNEIF